MCEMGASAMRVKQLVQFHRHGWGLQYILGKGADAHHVIIFTLVSDNLTD